MIEKSKSILVNKKLTLEQLQSEFRAFFPYLNIEFYKNGVEYVNGNRLLTLEKISSFEHPVPFEINGSMTVAEIEEKFETHQGIKIGIFRKLGQSSVETSFTSKWTLDRQNKIGSEVYFEQE